MASPANTEASEVRRRGRQRLIGAIALVAILVVFVPMVLDSEPKAQRDGPTMAIPSKTDAPPLPAPPKDVAPAKAPVAPATAPVAPATAPVSPAKAGAQAEPAPAAAPTAEPKPVSPKTDPKVAESKVLEPAGSKPAAPRPAPPAPPPAAAPKLEGFAVQVGAFRDAAKLDQARQKLAAAKVPHYTERVDAKDGAITRLRAGPYPTRDAAESAVATLKRSALEGKVVPLP
jgi:DedD protein